MEEKFWKTLKKCENVWRTAKKCEKVPRRSCTLRDTPVPQVADEQNRWKQDRWTSTAWLDAFSGHFRERLRGTFRGSFRGSPWRAENREINPRGSCRGRSRGRSRGRICGSTRGPTRGATRGPTRGSRFAFACSVSRHLYTRTSPWPIHFQWMLIDSVNIWCIIFFPLLKPLACGRQSQCLGWTYELLRGQKFSIKLSPLSVGFPQRRPLNLIKRPRFINSPGVRFINHSAGSL